MTQYIVEFYAFNFKAQERLAKGVEAFSTFAEAWKSLENKYNNGMSHGHNGMIDKSVPMARWFENENNFTNYLLTIVKSGD